MSYYFRSVNWNTNAMRSFERRNKAFDPERGIKSESFGQNDKEQKPNTNGQPNEAEGPGSPKPGEGDAEQQVGDQALVEVKVVFVRILKIDTVNQQYEAEVYIQARWAESQFAGFSEEQLKEIEFTQCWDPFLQIANSVGALTTDRASMLLQYEPDRVYPVLTYMWHVQGIFKESLELQHFPFDVEDISVVLTSQRNVQEVELVNDYKQLSNVSSRALQGNQEWSIYRHVEFTRDNYTVETLSATKHPLLVATAHAKRNLGLYFWNIFLIVLLILALSLAVLGIPPHDVSRFLATITMFLSCNVFKLVVKATLPDISYLTYLDIYVVFALIFLTMQATENSIMIHLRKFKSNQSIELYDEIAQGCMIAFLIIFHLVFAIHIQVTAFSRRRSMTDKELDYELTKLNLHSDKTKDLGGADKTDETGNALYKETKTSDSTLATQKDKQKPIVVKNPLFKK